MKLNKNQLIALKIVQLKGEVQTKEVKLKIQKLQQELN